jgi:hypothetical protein
LRDSASGGRVTIVVDLPEMPEVPETPSVFGYAQFVWNHIVREGSVIRRAPMAFIISMIIVGTL